MSGSADSRHCLRWPPSCPAHVVQPRHVHSVPPDPISGSTDNQVIFFRYAAPGERPGPSGAAAARLAHLLPLAQCPYEPSRRGCVLIQGALTTARTTQLFTGAAFRARCPGASTFPSYAANPIVDFAVPSPCQIVIRTSVPANHAARPGTDVDGEVRMEQRSKVERT
eukprot:360331-Chlamydomonas_euryale.AAC.12